jgi:DNA-binding MarR family transcriptional regulator
VRSPLRIGTPAAQRLVMLNITESRSFIRATLEASRILAPKFGLTPHTFDMLYAVHHAAPVKVRAADLARALSKSDEYVGRSLRRLEADGFIVRSRDGDDQRSKYVALTRKSITRLRKLARLVFDFDFAILQRGSGFEPMLN